VATPPATIVINDKSYAVDVRLLPFLLLLIQAQAVILARAKGQATFHYAGTSIKFIPAPVFDDTDERNKAA
jgi:hypothetical protein